MGFTITYWNGSIKKRSEKLFGTIGTYLKTGMKVGPMRGRPAGFYVIKNPGDKPISYFGMRVDTDICMPILDNPIAFVGSTATFKLYHQADYATYNSECGPSRLMTVSSMSALSWASETNKELTLSPAAVGWTPFSVSWPDRLTGVAKTFNL
jgi:hypothetical protein